MQISDEQLDIFIALYEKNFGFTPDRQKAYDEVCKLIQLVQVVCFGKLPVAQPADEDMVGYGDE